MQPRRLLLDVERLTFGPDALARADGQVVFVPFAAPGDRVDASVHTEHGGYLRARLDGVIHPGPERVVPGCPAFTVCGGCQWQHVAPAAQRAAKAMIVAEQLARVAGVRDAPVEPVRSAGADWGYRARITLVVEGRRVGYHRARSHRLVEIADCPIADPVLARHLEPARAWVASLPSSLARVTITATPGGVVLVGETMGPPRPTDQAVSETLLARHATVRGVIAGDGHTMISAGDPTVVVALEPGLVLEVPADVFTQVNPGANALLVETVVTLADVRPGLRVLDLYAGAGNFSFPLGRRGALVEGVERTPRAVAAAEANARRLGLGDVQFRVADAAAATAAMTPGCVDLVVLDPPRAGARAAIDPLVALRAARILYVSCDPATLARDVAALLAAGYRLVTVQPIDLFPQTFHVECVALLELT